MIVAPNAFVAEMLGQRLFGKVLDSVEKVAGGTVDLRIEVLGSDGDGLDPTSEASSAAIPSAAISPAGIVSHPGPVVNSVDESTSATGVASLVGAVPGPTPSRPTRLNKGYTFDSFIVGATNELAHAAAAAVADRPGTAYNPLFIYSDVGLGKTHLLTAIGHRLQAAGLSTIYATTEDFTNQFVGAIRNGSTEEFRARYRGADVLLLDDIQFLVGKEQTQEGFFHTFNALHLEGRQIVVTSDRPVTELTLLQDRVQSRLAGGLVVDIQPPDLETRLAILQAKAATVARGVKVAPEALDMLAELAHRNVRELEGGLNRAVAYAELTGCEVTADVVRRVVSAGAPRAERAPVTERAVIDAVSAQFGVDRAALASRRRDAHTALARHVAMYLLREEAHMALTAVGRALGGRDHSTVLHACNRIASLAREDSALRQDLAAVQRALRS